MFCGAQKMIREGFILLFFVSHAFNERAFNEICVTNQFEEELNDEFTIQFCDEMLQPWALGSYSDLGMSGPDDLSTTFISPTTGFSCFASSPISMSWNGRIEATIYMNAESGLQSIDSIILAVHELESNIGVASAINSGMNGTFATRWHDLKIELNDDSVPEVPFMGYLSFMGSAAPDSIVLVDSFRYIPPDMDEDLCEIYPTTTSTITTPTITTPTVTTPTITTPTITTPMTTPTPEVTTTAVPSSTAEDDNITSSTPTAPITPPATPPSSGFWNPLTITMVVLLWLIFLALICRLFYELGKKRRKAAKTILDTDVEDLPSSLKVPRVTRVYPDYNVNPYAKRND